MKEAAVQRRHNLYRDSIVLSNSDPNLHLLGESPSIDWAGEFGGGAREETEDGDGPDGESQKKRRMKQVVSMIQVDDPVEKGPLSPGVADIPEEGGDAAEETSNGPASPDLNGSLDSSVSKAEEQGEEETAAESRPIAVPPGPEEPPSSQEVLEEELPPPPPEEVLSAALETSSPEESPDFPPPPHDDDSGFQSPTAETEEGHPGQSAATAAEAAAEATAS